MQSISVYDPTTKPPLVRLTARAIAHIKRVLAGSKRFRLGVKRKGCLGFSYVVEQVTVNKVDDLKCSIEEGLDVFIDHSSLPFLQGIEIDYVTNGLNAALTFINPNEKAVCGCGESFSVDNPSL